MEIRLATAFDWNQLNAFFKKIYRPNHPLQNLDFWKWQYGDIKHGASIIAINSDKVIVGHVGAYFKNGLAWIINVYLDESYRGKGILRQQYDIARSYFPLAATSANLAGLGLYRNMNWIRYCNLQRYFNINPKLEKSDISNILSPKQLDLTNYQQPIDDYYWKEPGIKGITLSDGSTGVVEADKGGLRIVKIVDPEKILEEVWILGFNWVDYISSWNDPILRSLENNEWLNNELHPFPWLLNPIDFNSKCTVTFLSEGPLDKKIIVDRTCSDHGRVGSINIEL